MKKCKSKYKLSHYHEEIIGTKNSLPMEEAIKRLKASQYYLTLDRCVYIDLDSIENKGFRNWSVKNPGKDSLDKPKYKRLLPSIRDEGVKHPITVHSMPKLPGKYHMRDGRHRLICCKYLWIKKIPAFVLEAQV